MKTIQKTFSYRLKPSKVHRIAFEQHAGAVRWVFNWGLEQIKQAMDAKSKAPSYKNLANQLPLLKKDPETVWLAGIHSQVLQHALKNLENGMNHFWRRLKEKRSNAGFPNFKKKGHKDSFRYPQRIKCANGKICLPKIGWVAYRDSRPLEGKLCQATIKREGKHWFVYIVTEIERDIPQIAVSEDRAIGIDLGLAKFAHLSNDEVIENPRPLKTNLVKMRRLSKDFSRTKKGSNNRKKMGRRLTALHIKIANQRKDFLHKQTSKLIKNHDLLAVEDLTVKGMIRNRRLSRAIADAGWSMFLAMLNYKAEWNGKHCVKVGKYLPSTQQCSSCANKQEMPLAVRRYACKQCGINLDRDLNASKNIRAAGLSALNACGGSGIGLPREARISGL